MGIRQRGRYVLKAAYESPGHSLLSRPAEME
jgi:hypothetical protein